MLAVTGQAEETMRMLSEQAIRQYHAQAYYAPIGVPL
jgi:hypothetical protein